jgi:hypothetical protein
MVKRNDVFTHKKLDKVIRDSFPFDSRKRKILMMRTSISPRMMPGNQIAMMVHVLFWSILPSGPADR